MNPTSPTDIVPPPSYQISQEEFDQKSPHEADEDGWPHYDAAAYEAVAENHERSPPSSSSARVLSSDTTNRHESRRRGHRSSRKMLPSAPLKVRARLFPVPSVQSNLLRSEPSRLNETPSLSKRKSAVSHHHLHHLRPMAPLWMVRRLTKLTARPTMGIGQTQQQLQYWNLIHLHLGLHRHRGEFFRPLNLYNSGPIAFRVPNYRPHQTRILPTRYRQDQTLLQPSRVSNLTPKRPIRRTVAAV